MLDINEIAPDRFRIDVSEGYELRYWSEKFGVSTDRLKAAVHRSGPMIKDVRAELAQL